jgi:hypothetical protein
MRSKFPIAICELEDCTNERIDWRSTSWMWDSTRRGRLAFRISRAI